MTDKELLATARKALSGTELTLTIHRGVGRERAVRVSGGFLSEAEDAAREIADAIDGKFVSSGGFVAVWL